MSQVEELHWALFRIYSTMCSPLTMTWHIKWRARDWTSCFSPSRFSLGDHELVSTSQIQVRNNMAFEKKKDNIAKPIHSKNLSPTSEKCNIKRQPNNLMGKEKEGVLVGNSGDDGSIRALSSEENYIVFSFREDGEFDVVYDCKSVKYEAHSSNVHGNDQSSRRVNRKLDYGEGAEQVSDNQIQENISNANQKDNDQQITTSKEDEEKETITLNRTKHRDDIKRSCQTEEIEEDGRVVPIDSRDSNLSEGSRGSFAFPVLGWEMIGSPVKMPKSKEDLHLKKQKIGCVRFQCCRF